MSDTNPMLLRAIAPHEAPLALSVVQSIQTLSDGEPPAETEAEIRGLPESFTAAGGRFWVQEVRGALVGTIGVRPLPTDGAAAADWELKWLGVLPDWRGMGIGRMMAETALRFAREAGARQVRSLAHGGACELFFLLRSLGFQVPGAGAAVVVADQAELILDLGAPVKPREAAGGEMKSDANGSS